MYSFSLFLPTMVAMLGAYVSLPFSLLSHLGDRIHCHESEPAYGSGLYPGQYGFDDYWLHSGPHETASVLLHVSYSNIPAAGLSLEAQRALIH